MPLREQSRIKATASKAKKPIPAAAPEPSAPPLRGFETKGLWSDEELAAHERRATSPPPSDPVTVATGGVPVCKGALGTGTATDTSSVRDDDVRRTIAPMNWKEFEAWLSSGEDALGAVTPAKGGV